MAFNINEIRSNLVGGGARPNLFQVTITNPVNPIADLKLPFLCQATSLPASTIAPVNIPYFGRQIKIAGNRTFEPWSVNVMNDEDFLVRNALESWVNSINSLQGNINTLGSSPSLYKSQATVTQYSKAGDVIRTYQFNGIFPTSVGAIGLSWASNDTIESFDVTFQYDEFQILTGVTGNAGGV